MSEPFYANLDAIRDQLAAWLDMHSPPGGYRCLRCGDERWWIMSVRKVETKDYRVRVTPGVWTAVDIGCQTCHRIETYDITQLNIMP